MLPKRLLASIGATFVVPAVTFFSTGLYASEPLNLLQVYELALKNDAQLAAAQATFNAAGEAVPQSRAALLPTFTVTAQTADNRLSYLESAPLAGAGRTSNWNSHYWSATLTQPLFNMSSWFTFKRAELVTEQAAVTLAIAQQTLILQVAEAYFNILLAQESLATTIAEETALQRQLEQSEQRFEVGLIAETDVLEARAAYDSSRVTRIEAANQVTVAFEALHTLTNTPINSIDHLDKTMPVMSPAPAQPEDWVKSAIANNLTLEASRKGINIADAALKVSRSGYSPTLNAVAQYTHTSTKSQTMIGAYGNEFESNGKTNNMVYSLQLSVPIFSGLSTVSKVRQAGYELDASQWNYDQILRQISANARNLFNTVNADASRIDARCRAIESTNSALKATESGYEVGTRNIVDVLTAQRNLYSAQRDYLQARYNFILNTLRLKQTAGTLSPQDLKDLNEWVRDGENANSTAFCQ